MIISVILAVLNGEKYLDRSIKSFLEQDYQDKELIIIDGKSTDNSHSIIENYQKQNPHLIKWIKERDQGISNARNIAIKQANGDVIGFLGVDDVLHKGFFSQIQYYHSINSKYDVIYFDGYSISNYLSHYNRASEIPITFRNLYKNPPIASGECFYYKKYIFDEFLFNENNKNTMDYEFNVALAYAHKSFFGVSIPAIFNISDDKNISAKMRQIQRLESVVIQFKYAKNLPTKLRIFLYRPKLILRNLLSIINIAKLLGAGNRLKN